MSDTQPERTNEAGEEGKFIAVLSKIGNRHCASAGYLARVRTAQTNKREPKLGKG